MTEQATDPVDLGAPLALAPQLAAAFVSVASDVALVVDPDGVITYMALGADSLIARPSEWVGRPWVDTVTGDTRQKIEALLNEVQTGGFSRRREVNHPAPPGAEVPVAYAAIRLGRHGPVLAVGRHLRDASALQQRFIDAQRSMELDYQHHRQADERYRMLFQVAHDGVIVVDARTLRIVDANPAAAALFGVPLDQMPGRPVSAGFAAPMQGPLEAFLASSQTRAGSPGAGGGMRALVAPAGRPADAPLPVDLLVTAFCTEGAEWLRVRLRPANAAAESDHDERRLAEFVERSPDAIAIADADGQVLMNNPAFARLCRDSGGLRAAHPSPVGQSLVALLGDVDGRVASTLAQARAHGVADARMAVAGRQRGSQLDIELSAVQLFAGGRECLGLTVRRMDVRRDAMPRQIDELAAALNRLAAQIGIVALPELLQEATDLSERHLLESALSRAEGDPLQAAQWLGISAESLWLRMRHHRLTFAGPGGNRPPGALN